MTSLPEKQRPQSFDQVIGQDSTVKSLERIVKDGRAKSFVFAGPSGCGKTTLARILANMFAGGKATPANIVEADGANYSGVKEARELVASSYHRALGTSPVKAIILDECHRISANAWDALLKPIEEPQKHVYWMLCSTKPERIPKTILTRCQRYDLKPVDELGLFEVLDRAAKANGLDISDEILEVIAEGSEGSPRQALTHLEACLYAETANEARVIIKSGGQHKEAIHLCRFLIANRGRTWAEAMKIVKALDGVVDAESIRITVVNYLQVALINQKSAERARFLLSTLEPFLHPYTPSDRFAPLLHSVGLAIGLDA